MDWLRTHCSLQYSGIYYSANNESRTMLISVMRKTLFFHYDSSAEVLK